MSTAFDLAPAPTPAKRPSGLNARLIAHAVRRRPLALFGVGMLAAAAAAAVWSFAPLSKTTATVAFKVAPPQSVLHGAAQAGPELASYRASQQNLLRSRTLVLSKALAEPNVSELQTVRANEPAVAWLDQNLKVDTKSVGDVIRVTLEGDSGEDLTAILGAVSKVFLEAVKENEDGGRRDRFQKLAAEEKRLQGEVDAKAKRIASLTQSAGGATPVDHIIADQAHMAKVDALDRELRTARQAQELSKAALKAAEELSARVQPVHPADGVGPPAPPPGVALPEAEIAQRIGESQKLGQLTQLVAERRDYRDKVADAVKPDSERLAEANKELAAAEALRAAHLANLRAVAVRQVAERVRAAAADNLAKAQRAAADDALKVQHIEQDLAKLQKEAEVRAGIRIELDTLKDEIAGKKDAMKKAGQQVEEVAIEMGKNPPRVTRIEDPYVIAGLEGSKRMKFTLGAGLAVLVLGFGGLVGWEARSRRVTHTDDATTHLGVRLLGTVPPTGGSGQPGAPPAALAEAIDTARTMLLHGSPSGAALRTVLVTSGVAGEGKTSLAGHLAISLARAGFRTVLVDGDLQSPAAHRLFDCPVGPGLCELLRGEIDVEDASRPTPVPGLALLPAGRWDTAARQALVGDRWRRLKADLEGRYDFVVVDTAPLLLVSDTLLLAREADGVVLSVLLGVSQVNHVSEAAGRLQAVGAKLTGAVVNGVWHSAYRAGASYRYMAAAAPAEGQS